MPRKKKLSKKEYNIKRPPVVTMLGHVDHGKTSILDAIRGTKVQACEAGGITQSVRAHHIEYKTKAGEKQKITFIDTPGHEAFSQMRSRGANVTDIAVLVVAVDDSVQPQTKEAIEFAKKAKVPIIVALNKIDIKGVDKAKVKRELANEDVQVEELGGDVLCIETSAKKGTGLDDLMEAILLVAEMNEIKVRKPKKGKAEIIVLESTTDKSQGPIIFCLVKAGEIQSDDFTVLEDEITKIRSLKTEDFCNTKKATDSMPIWISGFSKEVQIGETLYCYSSQDDIKASKKVEEKEEKEEKKDEKEFDEEALSQLLKAASDDEKKELGIILKSETQGTLEVALNEIAKLSSDEVEINIIDSNTGEITEDDIIKAKTAKGIVIGFKSKVSKKNEKIARIEKVLVRNYEIIYEMLEEIAEVVASMKEPEEVEVEVARAKIKKVFELSDGSKVAGCKVLSGTIVKGYQCYVERPSLKKDKEIGRAKITSLKYQKDEVREASKGTECGIFLEPQIDIEKDDEVVCFKIEKE